MNKLESIKLYRDLQSISTKYSHLEIKNDSNDINDTKKLNSLLEFYKSNINQVKERSHFISVETRNKLKSSNSKEIYKLVIDLNNFANTKYSTIKASNLDIEPTAVKCVILATIDELLLINNSIKNKDYLTDKSTYFYIYEKIVINSFAIFLALKDLNIESSKLNNLSQAILSQIQTLSIISM